MLEIPDQAKPQGYIVLQRWNERLKDYSSVAGAFLALVVVIAYAGALKNGFVNDDEPQILENPFIWNPGLWTRIFTGSAWSFQGVAPYPRFYRPLQFFAYWLLYRLAGPNPGAYHLFQLVLYLATVLLVYRLGRELLQNELAAFVAALLWALHPLHVEAVAWIAALPDVGAGFFYLLGFFFFLRAEKAEGARGKAHVRAAMAYFPALFFKEMAFSLPLLLLAYWYFVAPGESWRRRAVRWLPYVVAVVVCAAIRIQVMGELTSTSHLWKVTPRVVGAGLGLLGEHTRLFFWPSHLDASRTFELEPSLRSPWPWMTLGGLFAAFCIRKRQPLLSFLVIWWGVTLLPCLDIRQLSTPLLSDRFSYFPSVGLCLAITFLAFVRLPERLPRIFAPALILPGMAVVLSFWSVQIFSLVPRWYDNFTRMTYSLQESPNSPGVHVVHGFDLLYRSRDFRAATLEYETALRLNSTSFWRNSRIDNECYLGLGQVALQQGRTEEARRYFEKAIKFSPSRSLAYDYLGTVYFPRRDYAKAAEYFAQAVRVNPYDLPGRFYLATCWMKLGKYHEAAEQFRALRLVDSSYWQAYESEVLALKAEGDSAEAAQVRALLEKLRGY